ncbi:MAG TPA: tetratricopeptide repeat protein, partial [Pyrinomonadaceae bacterium]|nr:tetratricopeptide repeat protein [Pyrinomonadaceae bacterium]
MKFQPIQFISLLLCLFLAIGLCPLEVEAGVDTNATQQNNAAAALQQGRRLLKRGNADQALVQLQTALDLYSAANNRRGIAAAHNELGDLYFRQGQSKTALDHYQKAFDALTGALSQEQRNTAVASSAASRVGDSRAGQLTETAASVSDTGFNAQLILAKIGDTNFRLGQMSAAAASYGQMNPKKPESAAKKAGGLFGKIAPSIAIGNATDSAALGSAAGAIGGALAAKNELDQYRTSIVYMTYHLGMGRIAFAGNDLEGARKHFQEAADAGKGALPMIANLGQTRRFKAAARTSLGDVSLRLGNFKQANSYYKDAVKEARDDKRPDLMWPAQRGLGRTQWLQAAQEKDSKKAMQAREAALVSYREALQNIETLRAGSLRADESRTTFLSTTKDVFDEAASALARMALLSSAPGNSSAGLSGKALEYAAEGFKVTEQSRARSLLDLLSETNASITEGVPADLLKQRQDNLEEQQQIAEQ